MMNDSLKYKIQNRIIKSQTTLLEALKQMDAIDKKLLFVFDNDRFINILSVGDIQRAILKNKPLESTIDIALRVNTQTTKNTIDLEEIKSKMIEFRMECMPILDDKGELVDVYFWEDLFSSDFKRKEIILDLPVVIMAGGKGTRLRPLTNILPKPLIPIGENTIIEDIMDRFVEVGCNSFYLSVNYKAEMIKHYFQTLNNPDFQIAYFEEPKPLGTAGSLSLLKGLFNQTIFITNCDIIIEEDYSEIYNYHKENQNELTIVAALQHYPIPYGTIESGENGILNSLTEKPELTFKINSGMYILEPHLIDEIPENTFYHITELIDKIKNRRGKVGVFPVSENSWKDIGNWDEYLTLAQVK